ncbi:MAG TPA: ssDNA-binding protein [Mycobacteriales bacterium]|nr:ssDNA-binding protein [Mycobacteriales bacterium]
MAKKGKDKSPERMIRGAKDGFPRGRLIWARLFEAEAMEEGQDKSFSCAIRFDEDADLDVLREGFKAACVDQFGSSKPPRRAHSCFIEGDELAELIEDGKVPEGTTEGMVILKLRRYEKYGAPQLWDQNVEPIESPTEMYSGCHVLADVEFYGWERSTGSGVSCRLNGLQKVREDEPLGGGKNETEESFERVAVKGRDGRRASPRSRNEDDVI